MHAYLLCQQQQKKTLVMEDANWGHNKILSEKRNNYLIFFLLCYVLYEIDYANFRFIRHDLRLCKDSIGNVLIIGKVFQSINSQIGKCK